MSDQTLLAVVDGDRVALARDDVVAAAQRLPAENPERGWVLVAGSWYDPLLLAAAASGIESRRLSWRSTVNAMHQLGFKAFDVDLPIEKETAAIIEALTGELDFVLTPSLLTQLQRYRGQWVGFRGDAIVEHAPTLRELTTSLGERSAAVMKVPYENEQAE